jgi:D-cysteine desulfhydrase
MVGLEPHLILRTRRANKVEEDRKEKDIDTFGYTGNILFNRMVGASIYTCTPGEYGRVGSKDLVKRVCDDIQSKRNKKVYPIPVGKVGHSIIIISSDYSLDFPLINASTVTINPVLVGGSNGLGTWGYIEGVNEIRNQLGDQTLDHVVFACGSGGTATGITLGFALSHMKDTDRLPKLHAIGVCDTPDYFYNEVASIADEMGIDMSLLNSSSTGESTLEFIRQHLTPHQGKGLGYAASTQEELDFITNFALETGIVLDPVYSGKALYHFIFHELEENPDLYKNSNVLFWHTGGSLGNYDKIDALSSTLEISSPVTRLDVYGKKQNT